jgi:hypothetical protein
MKDAAGREGSRTASGDVQCSLLAHLLERSRLYHTRQDYLELSELVSRLRNFAPYDAPAVAGAEAGADLCRLGLGLADPFRSFAQGGRPPPRHAVAKAVLTRA